MKSRPILALAFAGFLAVGGGLFLRNLTGSGVETRSAEVFVDLVTNGRISAADGVPRTSELHFETFSQPELLWIVGYRSGLVAAAGASPSPELVFESGVEFNAVQHSRIFELPVADSDRLFTLPRKPSEVSFPEGFGLPFYSDEVLTLTSRVLEPVPTGGLPDLRQQVSLRYVLDRDLDKPMKPLFMTAGQDVASNGDGAGDAEIDPHVVTKIVRPAYDTRLHFISGQRQPFLESITLRDLSTGESVYSGGGVSASGAADDSNFSSELGLKLFQDREYELITRYEATGTTQGPAAAAQVFLREKLFRKRQRHLAGIVHVDEPVKIADERLVVFTNLGQFQIGLYPDVAPRHVEQILGLSRLGVYDGVPFHRIEPGFLIQLGFPETRLGPPMTSEQQAALRPLRAEISDLPMRRWTVAMALGDNADPDSGVASFFILADEQRRLDQRFTIFGRILGGLGTLNKIAEVPLDGTTPIDPVLIERSQVMTRDEIVAARANE